MEENGKKILNFAKEILEIPSPIGYTTNIINFLMSECQKRKLKCERIKNGNLIIDYPGQTNQTLALAAHVDTLGAIVRSISNDGTLKFSVLGGPILPTYDGEYCYVIDRSGKVFTGTFLSNAPAVHVYKEARSLPRNDETMHIRLDEVVKSKQDVLNLGITNGSFVVPDPKTVITENNFIKSRFLDDKLSVAILFGLIDYLQENKITPKQNLKFIISTHEEMGFGMSYLPEVDEVIAVDMGCIGEDLSCTEYDVSICAKDHGGPYNFEMTNKLISLAQENKLNYVVDIYPFYSSDVTAALKGGNNVKGALIGPGVHASHGMERSHLNAVVNTLKLLIAYVK